jgi:antitoxin (DNA-binding transcriptional repressor) of toxin-antitoxin stability system
MQAVNITDLKNNLNAYLKRVRTGEELLIKDRNHSHCPARAARIR